MMTTRGGKEEGWRAGGGWVDTTFDYQMILNERFPLYF